MPDENSITKKLSDNWGVLVFAAAFGVVPNQGIDLIRGDRTDPFTGTEGDALEARIQANETFIVSEWRVERLRLTFEIQQLNDKLDLLSDRVSTNDENIEELQDER